MDCGGHGLTAPHHAPLTQLSDAPVAGVSMGNVSLLRLDQTGGHAPGNKHFKLHAYVEAAQRSGVRRLVSFGGPWSNHLHALAALGLECGFDTVGIVRGDERRPASAMLADARRWGMQLVNVSRTEYRRRNEPEYLAGLQTRFHPCLVIPEGGAAAAGVQGCKAIGALVRQHATPARHVLVSVGTGTTLAGLVAGLGGAYTVTGVATLKGALDLEQRVSDALDELAVEDRADWRILHSEHCGGFARTTAALREFMLAYESVHGIALEPVYTGKLLYAIHRHLGSGEWSADEPLLAVHTGGLQGRRGFAWLAD